MNQIVDQLALGDLDPDEVAQVILTHFSRSRGVAKKEIIYSRTEEGNALWVKLDDHGMIVDAKAGPEIQADDIDLIAKALEADLRTDQKIKVARAIMFAQVPMEFAYRYRDQFQILPVPAEAPQPQGNNGQYPFRLEVAFPSSNHIGVQIRRLQAALRELELILATLLHPHVSQASYVARDVWVRDGDRYRSLPQGYGLPDFAPLAERFADISALPGPVIQEAHAYYSANHFIPVGKQQLPSSFEGSLGRLEELPSDWRVRFIKAGYWLLLSSQVWGLSRSSSFASLVTAIEAMLTATKGVPNCEACGKPQGESPTAKFKKFLEEYLPGTGENANRSELYRIRSKISHGEQLFSEDLKGWASSSMGPVNEWKRHLRLTDSVRLSLLNWLHNIDLDALRAEPS